MEKKWQEKKFMKLGGRTILSGNYLMVGDATKSIEPDKTELAGRLFHSIKTDIPYKLTKKIQNKEARSQIHERPGREVHRIR